MGGTLTPSKGAPNGTLRIVRRHRHRVRRPRVKARRVAPPRLRGRPSRQLGGARDRRRVGRRRPAGDRARRRGPRPVRQAARPGRLRGRRDGARRGVPCSTISGSSTSTWSATRWARSCRLGLVPDEPRYPVARARRYRRSGSSGGAGCQRRATHRDRGRAETDDAASSHQRRRRGRSGRSPITPAPTASRSPRSRRAATPEARTRLDASRGADAGHRRRRRHARRPTQLTRASDSRRDRAGREGRLTSARSPIPRFGPRSSSSLRALVDDLSGYRLRRRRALERQRERTGEDQRRAGQPEGLASSRSGEYPPSVACAFDAATAMIRLAVLADA